MKCEDKLVLQSKIVPTLTNQDAATPAIWMDESASYVEENMLWFVLASKANSPASNLGKEIELLEAMLNNLHGKFSTAKAKEEGCTSNRVLLIPPAGKIFHRKGKCSKSLIKGLEKILSAPRTNIGGEIDVKVFQQKCKERYSGDEAEIKALEMCSLWQENMKNSEWHPYKIVTIEESSDSEHQRMDRSVAGSIHRRPPSVSQRHRLSEETVEQVDSRSSASLMEIETRSQAQTPSGTAVGVRTRLKDVSNALTTSRELLKIIVRIWSHNDPPTSSASLVSALHAELERTRLQVNRLIKEQLSEQNEINYMVKCFAKEKASWKSKQQQAVEAAIESIAGELDTERKLRRRSESFNKKLGKELADTKALLLKTVKELESEKRAREILEQVCDELASDIGGDRAEVEVLKRESAKAHEEVEREREMLHLADKLREERVQMKLSEAKHQFEEKNAVVDKLRNQLEAFLRPKKTKKKGTRPLTPGNNDETPTYLSKINFDFDQNDDKGDGEVDNEIDTDEDSGESDLHSIELNMDNNNKSFKWNRTSAIAHDSRRDSVDDKMRGRNSVSGDVPRKITSLQRSVSDGVEWGSHTKTMQSSGDALNQERFFEFEKQTQRKVYGDELQRYKSVKGLRDQILSSSRTGSAGDFPSPVRQVAQSRHPNDPVQLVQERLHVVQGSGSKSRLVEARGEGQTVRRSRR